MKCSLCKEIGHNKQSCKTSKFCLDDYLPLDFDETILNLSSSFTKCIKGYHLINDEPVKESPWEDINTLIIKDSGYIVNSQSNGSHRPGGDIISNIGIFSNKSAKYSNDSFKISSYRLTTVCSNSNPGEIDSIINEINNRKNFNFYSIIVREENTKSIIYDWYLIPSDFYLLNPNSYKWKPKIGKKGKNKDATIGWETDKINGSSMSITFSMSSQLWIDINITDEVKKFIISSCKVNTGKKYNYIQLYEMLNKSC